MTNILSQITALLYCGLTDEQIALVLALPLSQLHHDYGAHILRVRTQVQARLGYALYQKALRGDITALRHWCQAQKTMPHNTMTVRWLD